jgi:hypothetical protein
VKPWKSCNANRRTLRTWSRAFKYARSPASMAACGKPSKKSTRVGRVAFSALRFRVALRGFRSAVEKFRPGFGRAVSPVAPIKRQRFFAPFRIGKIFPSHVGRARPPAAFSCFHSKKSDVARAEGAFGDTLANTFRDATTFFFVFVSTRVPLMSLSPLTRSSSSSRRTPPRGS